MHPAPSLSEAPPTHEQSRNGSNPVPTSPESQSSPGEVDRHNGPPGSASPPVRKDTISSTATSSTLATITSTDTVATAATALSIESPNNNYNNGHAVFPVSDAENANQQQRRPSRRRTGPLSAEQREKAALIRKIKACADCRRRRVACEPSHHGLTWDDLYRKFRHRSPTMQQLAPLSPSGRRQSPSASLLNAATSVYHDPQLMDIDSPSNQQPGRATLSESRIRTPLPSGPRLDKVTPYTPMAGLDSPKSEMQNLASRILADPNRGRYKTVQALLLYWEEDDDVKDVLDAVNQLAKILSGHYNFAVEIKAIPSPSENVKSPWKWLSSTITSFVEHRDQRDDLKIVYYNGHSYLDADREMVLARNPEAISVLSARWSGIQQILEEASSDVLLLMDAAYYPSSTLQRKQGVFELLAASNGEDVSKNIGRNKFTRALSDWLYNRLNQKSFEHVSAAELHAKLLSSSYPKIIQERHIEKEAITSFPSPLHLQISGDARLPSISLAPLPKVVSAFASNYDAAQNGTGSGTQLSLTFRLADDDVNMDKWTEWLRMMPDEVKDLKVDGPYRNNNTFR
ncbi:hypothetical protein GE09DRAFT_4358 [Coniochaeta sp. 2T2.1]|nr:hypothetical protein GE09DRAFT_4358 [Coniochaeta sp. 2T2.1]